MQKKIVAAICAAALALAMPIAAFATTINGTEATKVSDSMSQWSLKKAVEGDNADLTKFDLVANSKWAIGVDIDKTASTASNYQAYTNDVMTQSFAINAYSDYKGATWDGDCQSVTYTIEFKAKKIAQLPTTVAKDNLYTRAYIDHDGKGVEWVAPMKGTSVTYKGERCSVVTAVLANGPLSYGQPVGTNNTKDLDDAAKNGNVSPKTGEIAA